MSNFVIVGLGSPFGDDRVGWHVAEAVRSSRRLQNLAGHRIQVECLDRPGPDLLQHFAAADHVILIDAVRSGAPTGRIWELSVDQLADVSVAPSSSHAFGLAHTLALAKALGELPRSLLLFGVEAGSTSGAAGLSLRVASAIPRLVARIIDCVAGLGEHDAVSP